MRHSLLLALLFFTAISGLRAQMFFQDLDKIPLGVTINEKAQIRQFFRSKGKLLKGSKKETFQLVYENVPFDKYGQAKYTFQYSNSILTGLDIEYSFEANEIQDFVSLMKALQNGLKQEATLSHLKSSLKMDYTSISNWCLKNCKAGYPEDDSRHKHYKGMFFGNDYWFLRKSKDFKTLTISILSFERHRRDYKLDQAYDGGVVQVDLSLSNSNYDSLFIEDYLCSNCTYGYGSLDDINRIELVYEDGVYKLPITINEVLTTNFIVDLGASDVSISKNLYAELKKAGAIEEKDILGTQSYQLANGSSMQSTVINIKHLKIGDFTLENVKASIANSENAPLLLGQSALRKLGRYSIDNNNQELIIDQ